MTSAFGVDHGDEVAKGLFGNAGKHVAGSYKGAKSLFGSKLVGGARKAGEHRAGTHKAAKGSLSPFQTGGAKRYQGKRIAGK